MQNIIKNIPIGFEVSARKRLEGIVNVSLYSQDIKTGRFAFMLVNSEGESVSLDSTYSAKALVKFQKSKSIFLDDLIIEQDIIKFEFPSNLIQTDEKVTMYIYITKESYTSDVIAITFNVYLSEVDKIGDVVASVYDGRYESVVSEFEIRVQEYKSSANVLVSEFEQALEDYKLTLPQADSVRAEIDVILNQFWVDRQAKLSQYDSDAQQVIADNQTAFGVAETGRQNTYEQAESDRGGVFEQAVADWEQGAEVAFSGKISEFGTDGNQAITDFNSTSGEILSTIESNESRRLSSEATRETSETARLSAEATRKTTETARASSETTRNTNETTRISNENARKSAEAIRLASESDRVSAENVRKGFYEGFDGRLEGLESGRVVLKNLVTNGDFSKGFDGWTVTGDVQNIGGRAKLVRLTGNPVASLSYRDKTIFASRNDVYYMSVQGELINRVSGSDGVMINDTVSVQQVWTLLSQPKGVVSKSSRLFNLSSNNSPYLYANTVAGSEYFIDHIIIVNLTEEFGVGKEPTKEWMDFLISQTGYFEDYFLGDAWQVQELMRMNNVKANKQQQAWITPTLINGFTGDVKYRKTDFGQLEIRGYLEYPSALNTNSNPVFAFVDSYTPAWIRSSGYSDMRLKMTLEKDISLITSGTARSSISGYNNSFYITDGGGGTRWHINALIPMD